MNPDDTSEKATNSNPNPEVNDVSPVPTTPVTAPENTGASSTSDVTPEQPTVSAPSGKPEKSSDHKRTTGMILILIAVMLLVVAGAVAYQTVIKKDDTKTTTEVVQKKDISVLNLGTTEVGFNVFPPTFPKAIANSMVDRQVFESLVAFSGTKIVPQLASSWTNPDDSTWLFKLKPNVKFHTGKLMTAADVKASIDAAAKQKEYKVFVDTLKTIEVVDDGTLKIVTKTPDPVLLSKLSFIFVYDSVAGNAADPSHGTGPYTIKTGTTAAKDSIQLVAFDDYHGGHVYTREVSFKTFKDAPAIVEAIKDGTINFAMSLKEDDVNTIKTALPSITSTKYESNSITSLYFATLKTGSPLQKKDVRQALYLALDPEAIIKAGGNPSNVASQMVPPTIPGYDPTFIRPKTDPTKAKELLKTAGYETGLKLSLAGSTASKTLAEEIKKELEAVGVTIDMTIYTNGDDLFNALYTGSKDLIIAAYATDINDLSDVASVVYTKSGGYYVYDNATVNELLKTASTTFDPAQRLKVLQQISRTVAEDYGSVPFRVRVSNFASTVPVVTSLEYNGGNLPGIYFWKVYQK